MNDKPLRIRCALCGKPVDRVAIWHHPRGDVTIEAHCHGASDSMTLRAFDIDCLDQDVIRQIQQGEGVAFSTLALPASP